MYKRQGAWLAVLPSSSVRARIDLELTRAGDWLGLCADEVLSMCLLSGLGAGSTVALLSDSPLLVTTAPCFGAVLPWLRLRAVATRRARLVNLALPATIDQASLCMSAGLDFPRSIMSIVQSAANPREPMIE